MVQKQCKPNSITFNHLKWITGYQVDLSFAISQQCCCVYLIKIIFVTVRIDLSGQTFRMKSSNW